MKVGPKKIGTPPQKFSECAPLPKAKLHNKSEGKCSSLLFALFSVYSYRDNCIANSS
jgi:hypothetical protein